MASALPCESLNQAKARGLIVSGRLLRSNVEHILGSDAELIGADGLGEWHLGKEQHREEEIERF